MDKLVDRERDELRRLRGQMRRVRAAQRKLACDVTLGSYGDGLAYAAWLVADALKPRGKSGGAE